MGIASHMIFYPTQAVLLLLFCSLFLYGLSFILGTGQRKSGMPPGRYLLPCHLVLPYTLRKLLLTCWKGPRTLPILGNEHQIPAADGHFL